MKKAQENKQDESANNSYSLSYQTLWKAIIRPPRMTYTNDDLGNPYFKYRNRLYFRRDFELLNNQGHILKCSFVEPTKEHRKTRDMPVVIYLHGNSSSRLEGLKMLTVVLRHDINLFALDFAGSGQSEGEYISLLTIDMEKVPDGFPNFNCPHGKIKFLIKEEDLKNQNYKNIKFYQEN